MAEAVLGHSPKGIEGVYNLHRYERECQEWLQLWCDHLDELSVSEKTVALGGESWMSVEIVLLMSIGRILLKKQINQADTNIRAC